MKEQSIKTGTLSLLVFIALAITGFFVSCDDSYDGPGPKTPTCFEFTMTDTVENMRGLVKLVDTLVYISNYVDETSTLNYYPCAIAPQYRKDGYPVTYSGFLRKRDGDTKQYIELTATTGILNETIITNYIGFIRTKDSASILNSDKTGVILNSKIENYKLKLLIKYAGCTKARTNFITLYKTIQQAGVTNVYGFITAPSEPCTTEYTLWYEFDVSDYKENTFNIFDGVKTHQFVIPK